MARRLSSYRKFVNRLRRLKPAKRVQLIRQAPPEIINAIIIACLSYVRGNLRVSKELRQKLNKKKNRVIAIARCRWHPQGDKIARHLLLAQRGGLLPLILAALPLLGKALLTAGTSIAAGAAGSAIHKAINKQ